MPTERNLRQAAMLTDERTDELTYQRTNQQTYTIAIPPARGSYFLFIFICIRHTGP